MPDNSAQIAELESILNTGAKKITTDGQSVEVDLAQVRRRLAELRATDTATAAADKRVRSAQIKLGGAW